jgi:hypothetical protein
MPMRERLAMAALVIAAGVHVSAGTYAEVTASAPNGFTLKHEVVVPVAPGLAWEQLVRIAEWWDPAHTYGGDASQLSLALEPGGCWCERLPDGGFVEHLRVVYAQPGRQLRFSGGLGPLQSFGVAGAMNFALEAVGTGTRVTLTYAVGGYAALGLEGLAKQVDGVLAQALARYARRVGAERTPVE